MKGLVNTYLNLRTGAPSLELNNNPSFYNPGDEVEIIETVTGESYKNNSIWFKLNNGGYVWSGGIDDNELLCEANDFDALNSKQQYALLSLAKAYYSGKFLSDEYGVTGVYVGRKNNDENNTLCLCFQVMKKTDHPEWKTIPPALPYKGFIIPTDIVEEDFMEMQFPGDTRMGRPGGSLSRTNTDEWGSCSFVAQRQDGEFINHYIVTNYHIAAFDLLKQNKFSYNIATDGGSFNMVMPSWKAIADNDNKAGVLVKGLFDEWHDTALIRVFNKALFSNELRHGKKINGILEVLGDETFIGKTVTMYGGFSGVIENKKIISVDSSQRTRINQTIFIKGELIQVERMSKPGDSGSPVLIDDMLVGIIIGADTNNSYLLAAEKIFSFFNLKIAEQ